jgi:putative transposase
MSVPERRAMVERPGETLSVRRQCALLNLARSGVYRPGPATGADDLAMMRLIDELHLKWPFYGSRRMVFELNQAGHGIKQHRGHREAERLGSYSPAECRSLEKTTRTRAGWAALLVRSIIELNFANAAC